MRQVAHLTDAVDGFLLGKSYLVLDRDAKYSWTFRSLIENAGIGAVQLPPRSPNMNALQSASSVP